MRILEFNIASSLSSSSSHFSLLPKNLHTILQAPTKYLGAIEVENPQQKIYELALNAMISCVTEHIKLNPEYTNQYPPINQINEDVATLTLEKIGSLETSLLQEYLKHISYEHFQNIAQAILNIKEERELSHQSPDNETKGTQANKPRS